jgi:class 3 adenylate cyclase
MTDTREEIKVVRKVVAVVDICSSTKILEDLLRTENQRYWRDLLIRLKDHLRNEVHTHGFELYKFLGDGWILLFDPGNIHGSLAHVIPVLSDLIKIYRREYRALVRKRLEAPPKIEGLTFGLDCGTLMRMRMNQQTEYVGRAINVASRLQGAVKDKDNQPQGKALLTNSVYAISEPYVTNLPGAAVTRELHNLAAPTLHCRKVELDSKVLLKK